MALSTRSSRMWHRHGARGRWTRPVDVLRSLPGVTGVNDHGQLQELRFTGNPQALLSALVARVPVRHFEVSRPSLHDIFVRIARPTSEELQEASHG